MSISTQPDGSDPLLTARWQVRRLRASLGRLRAQLADTQQYMDGVAKKLVHEAEDQIKSQFRVFPISRFYRHLSDKHMAAIQRQKTSPSTALADTAHLFKNYDLSKFSLHGPSSPAKHDGQQSDGQIRPQHNHQEEQSGRGLIVVDDNNPPSELVEFLHYQLAENANLKERQSAHRWQMGHMEHKVSLANNVAKEKSESLLRCHEVIKNYEGMLSEMRQKVHDLEFENISLRSKAEDMVRDQMKQRAQYQEEVQSLRLELSSPKRKPSSAPRRQSSAFVTTDDPIEFSRRRSTVTAESIIDTVPSATAIPTFLRRTTTVATQTDFVSCSTALPQPTKSSSVFLGRAASLRRPSSCRASIASVSSDPLIGNESGPTTAPIQNVPVDSDEGSALGNLAANDDRAANDTSIVVDKRKQSVGAGIDGSVAVRESFGSERSMGQSQPLLLLTGRPGSAPTSAPVVVQRLYKQHEDWASRWENKSEEIRRVDEALYQHSMTGHEDPSSHHVAAPPSQTTLIVAKSPPQQRVSPPRPGGPSTDAQPLLLTPPKCLTSGAADSVSSPRPPMSARSSHARAAPLSAAAARQRSPERLRLHNATYNYQKVFMITPSYEPALRVGVATSWDSAQPKVTSPKRR